MNDGNEGTPPVRQDGDPSTGGGSRPDSRSSDGTVSSAAPSDQTFFSLDNDGTESFETPASQDVLALVGQMSPSDCENSRGISAVKPRPKSTADRQVSKYCVKKYIHCQNECPLRPVAIFKPVKNAYKLRPHAKAVRNKQRNTSINNKSYGHGAAESSVPEPESSTSNAQAPSFQKHEHLYYISGNNGSALIEGILNSYGWKRTRNKMEDNWTLKWSELKSSINFNTFKEGEQLVNHIPNCDILTNKQGLLNSLNDYNRMNLNPRRGRIDFFPETYCLDEVKDKDKFLNQLKDGDIWICKPTGRNQGKGIFLVRSLDDYLKTMHDFGSVMARGRPIDRIVQRYISDPLLVDERKFDIRAYMLIASTVPYLVLYHKGYIRLSMNRYDAKCSNLLTHLTNQYIQKKDPSYGAHKEETVWTMDRFNDYVNEKIAPKRGLGRDWVYDRLTAEMQRIMKVCFDSAKNKLIRRLGYFEIYGFDFIVDKNLKVWLLEINLNPSLTTNCEGLKDVIPETIKEAIDIALECFDKVRKKQHLLPLASLKTFEILHHPIISTPTAFSNTHRRSSLKHLRDPHEHEDAESVRKASINANLSAQEKSPTRLFSFSEINVALKKIENLKSSADRKSSTVTSPGATDHLKASDSMATGRRGSNQLLKPPPVRGNDIRNETEDQNVAVSSHRRADSRTTDQRY